VRKPAIAGCARALEVRALPEITLIFLSTACHIDNCHLLHLKLTFPGFKIPNFLPIYPFKRQPLLLRLPHRKRRHKSSLRLVRMWKKSWSRYRGRSISEYFLHGGHQLRPLVSGQRKHEFIAHIRLHTTEGHHDDVVSSKSCMGDKRRRCRHSSAPKACASSVRESPALHTFRC
jgi:hypothetical protein